MSKLRVDRISPYIAGGKVSIDGAAFKGPYFDIMHSDYGAIPGAESTTAIQKAVADAAAAGGALWVPPVPVGADFLVSGTIELPSGSLVLGAGRRSGIRRIISGAVSSGRIFASYGYASWVSGSSGTTDITLRGLRLSMQGSTRPASSRIYATASFYGVDTLSIEDLWLEYGIQFNVDMDTCDNAHLKRIRIASDYVGMPVGNVDGVHFANCRDFSLIDYAGASGDDLVGVTTALGGRTSYRGTIQHVRGSSKEANGVVFNTESAGGFDLTDMTVDDIEFRSTAVSPTGVAVRFKGDAAAPGTFNVVAGRNSIVSNVRAQDAGQALDLTFAQGVRATNIGGRDCAAHTVYVNGSKDCELAQISSYRAGRGTVLDQIGVDITGSSDITVDGVDCLSDGLYGVQVIASTDISIDRVKAKGCGIYATSATVKGGIRVNASTRVAVGPMCRAHDDGGSFTKYGLLIDGSCADVVVHADLSQFSGVTKGYLNNANTGVHVQPGAPLAWVEFNPTAGAANYSASTSRNVSAVSRTADGDYTLTLSGVSLSTSDSAIIHVQAGAPNNTNMVGKVHTVTAIDAPGGTIRIVIVDKADALILPTKIYVAVWGRVGSSP